MISRRELLAGSGKVALLMGATGPLLALSGCNLADALTEAGNILKLIAPLGDGVASIVEIASPALAPAVVAATALYDAGVQAVEKFLSDWAAAAHAAQPGILSQAQAAVQTLSADSASLIAAAQIKDPVSASEIGGITKTITGEVSALLTVIPQIGALGGATSALARMAHTTAGVKLIGFKRAADQRSDLVAQLRKPTNTPIDAPRVELARKLHALKLQ